MTRRALQAGARERARTWIVPPLLGVLAFGAVLLGTGAAGAGDGWWSGLDEGEAVSLADVMARPTSFRGRTLTFFCIFHSREEAFDPVRTPFNARRHDNFSVWPDGAPIWTERAFRRDLPFLYIPRDHPQRDALLALEMITRIQITGKVRTVLQGRPFIEVFGFREPGHRLGRQVVRAINAGDNFARMGTRRGNQLAASRYRDALTPDLPPVYAMIVRKRLAGALRRLGSHADADRVERGETLGGGAMPEPDPAADPFPDAFPEPFRAPVAPEGRPRPVLPPDQLPGAPRELGDPPGGSGGAPLVPGPRTRDLPGTPARPLTPDDDLPGEASGNPAPPDVLPPPRPRVGRPGARPPIPPASPRMPDPGAPPTGSWPERVPPVPPVPPRAHPPAPQAPPLPAVDPEAEAEATRRKQPPLRRDALPGVPPKRKPRLSGVK